MSFKDEVEVFLVLLLTAFFSSKMNILTLMLKSRKQTLGKTRTERSVCYNIVSEVQIQDHCDFRKYCLMIAETLVVTHFWTLNVYWTDYYLDRMSFRLPVTKFSQDWIIFFSDIVHDDSWPWYLVAHEARFLKKKKNWWPKFGPNGPKVDPKLGFSSFSQVWFSFHWNCLPW